MMLETRTGILAGKVALITGGGNGIGRAIALLFAREGARVAVADLDEPAAAAVAKSCAGTSIALDVADPNAVGSAVDMVVQTYGRLDLLVNSAGVFGQTASLLETPVEEWDKVFAVNARGTFCCLQAAARVMARQGGGVIINLSSVAAKEGRRDFATYGATKAAILNLTWSAALELAPYSIRVNAICPGPVDTELWRRFGASRAAALGIDPGQARREREEQVPLKRFAAPEEVAEAALFLASPAASYLTGTSIDVAGGAHTG